MKVKKAPFELNSKGAFMELKFSKISKNRRTKLAVRIL